MDGCDCCFDKRNYPDYRRRNQQDVTHQETLWEHTYPFFWTSMISWQKKTNEFSSDAASDSKISVMWLVVTVPKAVHPLWLLAFRNFRYMEVKWDYSIFTRENGCFFEQDLDPNHVESYLKVDSYLKLCKSICRTNPSYFRLCKSY